jgi:hypothetical protein
MFFLYINPVIVLVECTETRKKSVTEVCILGILGILDIERFAKSLFKT